MEDFIAGSIAGAAGVIAGHPLDTIKTRMQTCPSYSSLWQCFTSTVKSEGGKALLRGMAWPVLSKSLEQCLGFGLNQQFKRRFTFLEGDALIAASGASTGAITFALLTPINLVKVQMQVPRTGETIHFRSSAHCFMHNAQTFGVRGVFTGLLPTLLANPIAFGTRFLTYDKCNVWLQAHLPGALPQTTESAKASKEGTRVVAQALAGGAAGVITWVSAYPLDVIVTRMQAQGARRDKNAPRRGMVWHIKDTYRAGGVSAFFRGLEPCLLRAFPVNAIMFLTYEEVVKLL